MPTRKSIPESCVLCKRYLKLTFHHLVPKLMHKRRWVKEQFTPQQLHDGIWVCKSCHTAIHRFIDHGTLAKSFHTVEQLQGHSDLAKFVRWNSTQRGIKKVHRKRD